MMQHGSENRQRKIMIGVRVNKAEYDILQEAADLVGAKKPSFLRVVGLKRANSLLREKRDLREG